MDAENEETEMETERDGDGHGEGEDDMGVRGCRMGRRRGRRKYDDD